LRFFFVQVLSNHLLLTRAGDAHAGDAAVESKAYSVANIEVIPTSTELLFEAPAWLK